VNYFGLIFLAIAFVLFILDIKAPTHGALTVAGIASLIVGALVLFNSPSVPSFQRVSVPLVVGTSIATGMIFLGIVGFALRAMRAPVRTGQESLMGRVGSVRKTLDPSGTVQLGSELWTASVEPGEPDIPPGTRIQVVRVEGVRLVVRKVEQQ
jgi:membrane-bound serine protease (ClpP class)